MDGATHKNPQRTLVIAPNGSLSIGQAQWFFIYMCALSVIIACILTAQGLWLVWPFSVLEMAVLGAGLQVSMRHSRYREVVSIYDNTIEIDAGHGHSERHWEFPRLRTQIQLQVADARNSPSHLLVTRSGRGCELAQCLTEEERQALARRLKSMVMGADANPQGDG